MPDHCVKLRFPFSGRDLQPIHDLEDLLIEVIDRSGVGEFDGNDVGEGECILYMYGSDADELAAVIRPIIAEHQPFLAGGHLLLRYGPAVDGVHEVQVSLPTA